MPIDYANLPVHEAADLFPLLGAEEHAALVESVLDHGLLQPLVLLDQDGELLLLDGRNRLRACIEAGVDPHHVMWDGEAGDPVRYVWAVNSERRHLAPGQRAAAAVAMLPLLEKEARDRIRDHGGTAPGRRASEDTDGIRANGVGPARDLAASAVGVSGRYVQDAKRVSIQAPEVFDALREGVVTIPQARMMALIPEEVRADALARVRSAPVKNRTKLSKKLLAAARPAKSSVTKLGPPAQRQSHVLARVERKHRQNLDDLHHLSTEGAIAWLEGAISEAQGRLLDLQREALADQVSPRATKKNHNALMDTWRAAHPDLPIGAVIYEGPSRFTGEHVIVALTKLSDAPKNTKTGDMVMAYILPQATHPGEAVKTGKDVVVCGSTCPHRPYLGGRCYVQTGTGISSRLWAGINREDLYPRWSPDQAAEVLQGAAVRIGAWGDPTSVPVEVWRPIVKTAGTHTAYTHYWRDVDVDVAAWGWAMASVDSPQEAMEARAAGWRTFRVRDHGDEILDGEKECSAVSLGIPCIACRGCDGVSRAAGRDSYWIRPHGFRAGG